ncbi:hypothetical protein [Butyrivibrio sp. AE3003]|uniref:hypothetical protein n=1 Tax=Butyrivibrio sp. AE3003 TaxID=1496721 RepID=UPI00047E5362|nr:hypothetical protein [Butyrivibrio sp. AE3003]
MSVHSAFFAATFGVGLISSIDMIGSLCNLMSRGAIISMFTVFAGASRDVHDIRPKIIIKTTLGVNPGAKVTR